MIMKKIIILLFASFAFMQNVSAQDYYESSSDIYGLGGVNYQKKWNRTFSFSIAKQVELGFNVRRNFGQYFAWDIWSFTYGYDYASGEDVDHEIEFLRTGIRGFSPQFGKIKAYGAVGFGPEYIIGKKDSGAMRIDLQLGVYVSKRFSIGYQADFHRLSYKGRLDHTDHMLRLAVDF